jgi:predicted enzyme related to lactoylglutathione lyase
MKKSILGLRTCIYYVPDLQKAIDWYTQAFETEPYFNEPFYVGFNVAGYELGLLPQEKPLNRDVNIETYWGVENAQEQYDRFISLGAIGHSAPQNVGGEIVVATVLDPWGNAIGLIYNPEFKLP